MLRLALSLKNQHQRHVLTSQRVAYHQGYGDAPSPLSPVNPTADNKDTSNKGDEAHNTSYSKNNNNTNNNNTISAPMQPSVEAYSEGTTTLLQHSSTNSYRFIIDEPEQLGGSSRGLGPNPITMLLGSLLGCSQYTAVMLGREQRMAPLQRVSWSAQTEYDLQGVVGNGTDNSGTASSAKLQSVRLRGTVDTDASQEDLDALTTMMIGRNIIAATLKAAGAELDIKLEKGQMDYASELHNFMKEAKGGVFVTGTGGPNVDKQGDAPQYKEDSNKNKKKKASVSVGAPSKRGMHTTTTLAANNNNDNNNNQQHHPSLSVEKYHGKDGEDISRANLNEELEPQIQKEMSERGSPLTRGGAYASRDHSAAQGAFLGEENGEVVEKERDDENGSDDEEEEGSPLGDRPNGEE